MTQKTGLFFHWMIPAESGAASYQLVQYQGVVESSPETGVYQVLLFDWLQGDPCDRKIVKIEDMATWRFYPSAEAMRDAYEKMPELPEPHDGSRGLPL